MFQTYKKGHIEESLPHLEKSAIEYLINHNYRGNVRELKNILMRAMIFRKTSVIRLNDIIEACQTENPDSTPTLKKPPNEYVNLIIDQLESGKGDFWSKVHQPFKKNKITKDTVKTLMQTAKNRYQSNLPGLAIKLGACSMSYQCKPNELKKFISFKNFLYKTIKISETN